MKNYIATIVLSLMIMGSAAAQGIEFFHGTWAQAQEKAKAEGKIIFVDCYASWCGPCKRMTNSVFPQQKAGEFYNANFVNLKVDMEKDENAEFASKYPVMSYPTLMFIDANTGKIVVKDAGARDVDALVELGKKVLGKTDKSIDFEKKYAEGNRDPQFLYDYVRTLNAGGKPSLKIINEYLNTQTDFTTEFNLRFILEGTLDVDSRVFDLLAQNRAKIVGLAGEDAVNQKVERAFQNTVSKAIEFRNQTLLGEAKDKIKKVLPARAAALGYDADMHYYAATKDVKNYLKSAQAYQKSEIKGNASKLHDLVVTLMRTFPSDAKVLDQAQKWAKTAAENGGLPEYYMTLAGIYRNQGDKAKAKEAAQKALQVIGDTDNGMKPKIEGFIQSL